MVSLRRLLPSASFVGATDIVAAEVTERSGDCTPGCLFAAIAGTQVDGVEFIKEAIANGAVTVLVDAPLPEVTAPQCVVPNVREAYSLICQAVNRAPSQKLKIAGVTGTNGKTTVTWLLRSILTAAGNKTGLIGTIETDSGESISAAELTTPDSRSFAQHLSLMVDNSCTHAAVELSSHALDQSRVAGVSLAAAIVTNVTQDHFDYHADFDNYCKSKSRIAKLCADDTPLWINADDEGCEILAGQLDENTVVQRFGIHCSADVKARVLRSDRRGSHFEITYAGGSFEANTSLVGEHNVSNCLAAATAALQLGVAVPDIIAGLQAVKRVPGRMQRINLGQPFEVYVDYAHTEDALRNVIRSVRQIGTERILCVFGAGGDRDQSKRPLLGKAASEADVAILTSDNPRDEDPASIIQQIAAGVDSRTEIITEIDRALAIKEAIQMARRGDTVIIAGKGHESTQTVGAETTPFDDRIFARRSIADLLATTAWKNKRMGA